MANFYHKRHNILVCLTIIETGIDIPSANTIIINEQTNSAGSTASAERPGRTFSSSGIRLLASASAGATENGRAEKNRSYSGCHQPRCGFTLASHDLEIRGAGELLGDEQSGHMQKIGFALILKCWMKPSPPSGPAKRPALRPFQTAHLRLICEFCAHSGAVFA